MNVEKFSVSLSRETLAQMELLRQKLGLYPKIKRSQLISQIIFDAYCRFQPAKPVTSHGFPDCKDDCASCNDQFVCDFYKET